MSVDKGGKVMGRVCVLDTETTGLVAGKADLIQIACMVLKPDWTPDKLFAPFYMLIKPKRFREGEEYLKEIQHAMSVNGLKLDEIMKIGFDATKAAELFDEWWQRIGSQPLEPLCQNYPFDRGFVQDWLGPESYSQFFSRYYRDTYAGAQYMRDKAYYSMEKDPFPRRNEPCQTGQGSESGSCKSS
jgi:hypothetical protein